MFKGWKILFADHLLLRGSIFVYAVWDVPINTDPL
jgi:hypothetical protein